MSARASDTVFWLQIPDQNCEDYIRAAEALIAERFDVVCFQHEFGIFGGEAGSHIVALLVCLEMPVVTTLHAVLAKPNPAQRRVLTRIIEISAKVVVMAEKGRSLLRQVYGVQMEKIDVISDGIPDIAFSEPDVAKAKLGFGNRSVILTFGLRYRDHDRGFRGCLGNEPPRAARSLPAASASLPAIFLLWSSRACSSSSMVGSGLRADVLSPAWSLSFPGVSAEDALSMSASNVVRAASASAIISLAEGLWPGRLSFALACRPVVERAGLVVSSILLRIAYPSVACVGAVLGWLPARTRQRGTRRGAGLLASGWLRPWPEVGAQPRRDERVR